MGYIPPGAQWYLADVVLRISVEGDPRWVTHVNVHLVRADSPEEAHAKALALGRQSEDRYENPAGKQVRFEFVGLRDLNVVHDPLEDGAELAYEERVGASPADAEALVHPREALGVFAPIAPREGPDYSAGDVVAEAEALLRGR